jgi:hypothetical protein
MLQEFIFWEWLSKVWAVKQRLPAEVDVIMCVTLAATEDGLTQGSHEIVSETANLSRDYPSAKIVYSAHALANNPHLEHLFKSDLLPRGSIYAGEVSNIFDEAYQFYLATHHLRPRSIMIVADEWSSRSMAYALRKVFAGSERPAITVFTIPGWFVLSSDNPIKALRSHWRWALTNILRHLFMVVVPGSYEIMLNSKNRQPTT